jgi:DNA-binding SARP family transcriptional activator/ABC-type transport system substrate-binding protein
MPAPLRLLTRAGWPEDVAKTSQSSRNLWLPSLVDFAVLGALAVQRDSEELPLGGPKQRALLAILLLNANTAVSRDRLIDGIWGERPPPTAAHTLDNYISRLRKTLGDGRVSRQAPGYLLEVMPDELDFDRFERLLAVGREHLAAGDAAQAARDFGAALALWRGPALADLRFEPFAVAEADRLEELRLQALEYRIEADLVLGGGSQLVPELEALVREHRLRERPLGLSMLALYRAGRQAEALAAYQAGRRRLGEELGLEPGPQLRELQRKILEHDPSLAPPLAASVRSPQRQSPRRLVTKAAVVAAVAAVASVVIGIAIGSGGRKSPARQPGDSRLVAVNTLGGVGGDVALGDAPAAAVAADGSLWLASPGSGVVTRVADSTHTIVDSIPVSGSPALLAAGGGSIWVASALGASIARVDPRNGAVSQTVSLGSARVAALTFGGGALWVANAAGDSLLAIDPVAGRVVRALQLSVHPTSLAFADGTMWIADYGGASVAEVDLRTGQTVANIHVGGGPAALAVGLGGVWVANSLDSTVSRINPLDGSVAATIPVGSGPSALLLNDGLVWVANQYAATVSRIDPRRNAVVGTSSVGGGPAALAADAGNAWVAVRALVQHRGGTLTLAHTRVLDIDPAINVDVLPLQSDGLTRDGLVTYNHVPGPDGTQLIPDLAINLPAPTDGGTSYTFRLRAGIRYSDGQLVRASDFRLALERVLRLRSQESAAFDEVLGADACSREACDLSRGVVPDNRAHTVTFHLRSPDPEFLNSLATPQATAVPPGTPFHDVGYRPIPSTGPYEIAAAGPHEVRWIRNPFFHEWSHAAQPEGDPDQIVMRFGLSPTQEVRAIENGTVDWSGDFVPSELVSSLKSRFASQVHAWTIPTTEFVQFNTTRAPFNDIRGRRAFNLAVDRRHVAQLYGGSDLATPTCQILPPGLPGHRPYCPYAHDVARARTLVSASGTQGQRVTVWSWTDDTSITPGVARYYASVLRELGYRASVRLVSHAYLADPPPAVFRQIQLIPAAWGDTPAGFFTTWFSCSGTNVHGDFCDHRIDREIARAQTLEELQPRAANALWARLDHELVDRAVWAPVVNDHGLDFVSAQVHDYEFHPYWGLIADQLWLQ